MKKRPSDGTAFDWRKKPEPPEEFVPDPDPSPASTERIDVLLAGKWKDPQEQSDL